MEHVVKQPRKSVNTFSYAQDAKESPMIRDILKYMHTETCMNESMNTLKRIFGNSFGEDISTTEDDSDSKDDTEDELDEETIADLECDEISNHLQDLHVK